MTAPPKDRTPNPATARIAQHVREARQARGWSQERLAIELTLGGHPVGRDTIADLEAGRRRDISVALLVALAGALHVPAADLLGEPGQCDTCHGRPPRRFRCMDCGLEGAR